MIVMLLGGGEGKNSRGFSPILHSYSFRNPLLGSLRVRGGKESRERPHGAYSIILLSKSSNNHNMLKTLCSVILSVSSFMMRKKEVKPQTIIKFVL
jgi:hypothetical protein